MGTRYEMIWRGKRRPVTRMTDIHGERTFSRERAVVAALLIDEEYCHVAVEVTPGELLDSETPCIPHFLTIGRGDS